MSVISYSVCAGYTLVRTLAPGRDLLVCLLVVTGCYNYYCLSSIWPCTKVEGASGLPLGRYTSRDGQLFQA